MSGETQFGFLKGLGTREAFFSMKLLIQKCYDQRRDMFICFKDYQKAFGNVKHNLLLARLQEIDIDSRDIRVIQRLYLQQESGKNQQQSHYRYILYIQRGSPGMHSVTKLI